MELLRNAGSTALPSRKSLASPVTVRRLGENPQIARITDEITSSALTFARDQRRCNSEREQHRPGTVAAAGFAAAGAIVGAGPAQAAAGHRAVVNAAEAVGAVVHR